MFLFVVKRVSRNFKSNRKIFFIEMENLWVPLTREKEKKSMNCANQNVVDYVYDSYNMSNK